MGILAYKDANVSLPDQATECSFWRRWALSRYDGIWRPEYSIHGPAIAGPQGGAQQERFHGRPVTLEPTSDPVWVEVEEEEAAAYRKVGLPVPFLAPDSEAKRTAVDVYVSLPDRLMARVVPPSEGDPTHIYYLFFVPTTFSAARGITPRRLRLQLLFEDASGRTPPGVPVAYELDPATQVATKLVNFGKLKIDLGSALKALWPTMPDVLTAQTGGSLDLRKVDAKVQAEGRNSQQCGWRISDAEIAYDFNPSCIVQVPRASRLSVSATLHVEVWKQLAFGFHKAYLIMAEPAVYVASPPTGSSNGITLDRSYRERLQYSSEGRTVKARLPRVNETYESSVAEEAAAIDPRDEPEGEQEKELQAGSPESSCALCNEYFTKPALTEAPIDAPEYCRVCLGLVIGRCPSCGTSIPGLRAGIGQENSYKEDYTLPIYCTSCRRYYPWVTNQQKVYWLERFIDRMELDGQVRLLVGYNLRLLRVDDDLDEDEQLVIWDRIKILLPDLFNGLAWNVIEILLTARMKERLGLG